MSNSHASSPFEITTTEVKVGKEYPVYGMITNILDDSLDNFLVVINFNLKVRVKVDNQENLNIIKDRIYEQGIFLTTITDSHPVTDQMRDSMYSPNGMKSFPYEGVCNTVIYGRKKALDG